jgi:molybdopterin-guanine dinucleotide biosynthesis protein A
MAENPSDVAGSAPALHGLVLAGGRGTRLGRDKGELDYHGVSQARWAFELLRAFCAETFVSIRPEQAGRPAYRDLPLLTDRGVSAGPASGLAAALRRSPGAAWLVVAADMPLLRRELLANLVADRDSGVLATAYRHRDGTPEPLCAIWEPAAGPLVAEPGVSLRRLLETGPAKLLELADDAVLASVNTPEDDAAIRRALSDASR